MLHDGEGAFLKRIADIFKIGETQYQAILARHVDLGASDPYAVLGVRRGMPLDEIRRNYHRLVAENHPDRLIARGVPEEFIAIATTRIAAINVAFDLIERGLRAV